jgi:uncharacterized protein (TIGR02452 family)
MNNTHWSSKKRIKNPFIAIYQHTIEHCIKSKFPVYKPLRYSYSSDEFEDNNFLAQYISFNEPAKVLLENIDSFDMARKMNISEGRILVLNLASDTSSGGGVKRGAKAQEEDLYRKSNYFEANNQKFYPLATSEVIYSPLVHIIKDSSYKLLQEPYPVSCLAVAAIRNPKLKSLPDDKTIYFEESDAKIMQNKIDMIFKIAIKYGHKDIVLGALGCGVYNNPTEEVAKMFKNSLIKYTLYFKRIGFAILSESTNPNFMIFQNIINDVII